MSTWLPATVDRRVRVFAWLSLASQTLIVATGGAVRLTGSGLGCDSWPTCTPGSLVVLPEQGIHGAIEFGNRMMTFVLAIIAIATIVLLWRIRKERRDLFVLSIVLLSVIPIQAVLGGISVWTGLNPFVVGLHFLVSVALVAVASVFVYRVYSPVGPRTRVVPLWFAILTHLASLAVFVTIVFGILTTGSGPHAGDADAPRNGLNSELLQHIHSIPGYIVLGLSVVLFVAALVLRRRFTATFWGVMLAIVALQVIVGITQARLGLPPVLVGIHMVLASLLAGTMAVLVLSMKDPLPQRPIRD